MEQLFEDHQLEARQQAVETSIATNGHVNLQDGEELEQLDQILTAGRLEAERQCGKLVMDPWTPLLKAARLIKRHWELWLKELKTGRDLSIQRLEINAELPSDAPSNPTFLAAKKQLLAARTDIKDVLAKARDLRDEFLLEKYETYMKFGEADRARKLEIIRKTEARNNSFRYLKLIRGKLKSGSLQYIMVPDEENPGKWVGIFDQQEINIRLKERNRLHFSQAEGTPFTTEPMQELFGRHANTFASHELKHGRPPDGDTTEAATEIRKHLASE